MNRIRIGLGALGVLATAYGARLLLLRPADDLVAALKWLVAGVVVHDLVLSPLVLAAGAMAAGRLAWRGGGAVVGGLVVIGTVTLMAVPVLGRFGAIPQNPSLLNRDYVAGWFVMVGLVVATVAVRVVAARRGRRGSE